MTYEHFFYIFYSFIQGITEFIPISSTGHLNIIESIYHDAKKRDFLYETSAHFASLMALLFYLFRKNHFEYDNIKNNFFPITIATIPALILGFFVLILEMDVISLKLIGYTSIIGGLILYIADSEKIKKIQISDKKIIFLIAGMFQCLAFLPGFSRSGSCIIAFRLLGKTRKTSSIYSLYLGVPLITLSFLSNIKNFNVISFDFNLLIVFFITFITAYITIILFIKFINTMSFTPFVIYRIILGIVILNFFS